MRRAWVAALFAVIFARVLLLPRFAPDILLDSSYAAALTYFRAHGLQFGKDVLYTFGPLGYLLTGVLTGYAESVQIVGAFALAAVLAFLFSTAALRLPGFRRCLFIAAVLVSDHNEAIYLAAAAAAWLAVFGARRQRHTVLALIGGGMALIASIKFTFFMAAALGVALAAVFLWLRRERRHAITCAAAFAVTYGILWAVFGGGWVAFWLYLRGSLELASGYAQVMYTRPEPRQLIYGLACATLCSIVAGAIFLWKRQAADRMNTLLWMALLFLAWKHGFVRADASHLLTFFLFIPFFVAGIAGIGLPDAGRLLQASVTALVLGVAVLAIALGNPAQLSRWSPEEWADETWQNFHGALRVRDKMQELHSSVVSQAKLYALGDLKTAIGSSAVDVFGQGQSLAILNGLTYRPRPVFQSFASFTPYLIRRNYDYYAASAPPFILFGYGSVNGAYPAQNDSLALAWVLANYTPAGARFDHLLLRRIGNNNVASAMRLLGERTLAAGERIEIPAIDNGFVWCTVEYPVTLSADLQAALFQPRSAEINFEDSAGVPNQYRFERGPAKVGFIANPLLKDLSSVAEYLCGVDAGGARTLQIQPERGVKSVLARFYSMPVPRQAPPPSVCASTLSSLFSLAPSAIYGFHRGVEVDGKTRLLAHAPAKVKLEVPDGAVSVRGEFGFMPGAYENAGATDGVVFRVLTDDGDGASKVLWEKWLRPKTNSQDRGILPFRAEIPGGARRLVLQTDPGPAGDNSWDWSVWSGVDFDLARSGAARTGSLRARQH